MKKFYIILILNFFGIFNLFCQKKHIKSEMNMSRNKSFQLIISCFLLLVAGPLKSQSSKVPLYKNANLPIEKRVADLISRMTIEEKVYQMCALRLGEGDEIFKTSGNYSIDNIRQQMETHGIGHLSCPTTDMYAAQSVKTANEIQRVAVTETRLGIPVIINDDALHGCGGKGSTSYPQSIALSCTWDLDLISKIGNAIGQETYSRGIRQALDPVLDLARDPRHGRMEETYGEDPFLAARFGVEFIKGVQQNGVICSPKHFLANFVTDGGRDAGNVAMSERELREIHMVPYKAAVVEANTQSVMAAYNAIDGVPCSDNHWLLNDVLRKEWGFSGFVVSDWSGVNHTFGHHKIAQSLAEAAVLCSKAGLDVDLPRLKSYVNLIQMVKEGKIKESSIDENVRHILRVKFKLGLFENPYVNDSSAAKLQDAPEFRQLARRAAGESIILLKNNNNILPLTFKNIAVIGPNADKVQLGGYSARDVKGITPLQGIKNIFGANANITFSKGCTLNKDDKSGFEDALKTAKQADVSVLLMGGQNGVTGGETQDRINLNLMGVQEDLITEVAKLGKPVVVVIVDGRPSTMMNWINKVDGVIMMFFAGEEGGNALGEILAGKLNPSGKTTVTIPRHTGQLPMPLIHRPYGREGSFVEYPEMSKDKVYNEIGNRYYPLFPFGFGLSYTTFQYGEIQLGKKEFAKNEKINLSVEVTNTGKLDGDEIVQLYLTDLYSRISQSKKQMKAFKRVSIPAGATKLVSFTLTESDLAFLNEKLQPEVEAGEFEVLVGTNCMDGKTKKIIIK